MLTCLRTEKKTSLSETFVIDLMNKTYRKEYDACNTKPEEELAQVFLIKLNSEVIFLYEPFLISKFVKYSVEFKNKNKEEPVSLRAGDQLRLSISCSVFMKTWFKLRAIDLMFLFSSSQKNRFA